MKALRWTSTFLMDLNKQKEKRFFLNGRLTMDFDILIELYREKISIIERPTIPFDVLIDPKRQKRDFSIIERSSIDFDVVIDLNKKKKKRFSLNERLTMDFDIRIDLDRENKRFFLSLKDQPLSSTFQLT